MHFPTVMLMNVGILPCRSSRVCILTTALCWRILAHGNSDRHNGRESARRDLCVRSTTMGSSAWSGRAMPINTREVGVDAPVVALVSVGQCGARYPAAKSHVIQFAAHRAKAGLDVAPALPVAANPLNYNLRLRMRPHRIHLTRRPHCYHITEYQFPHVVCGHCGDPCR